MWLIFSYQCNGENVHLHQRCGYNGYSNLMSGSDSDCWDTKWFVLGRWGMPGISKSEFPGLINHHYSTSFTVRHADIQVSVLNDVFDVSIPWIQRLDFIIKLYSLNIKKSKWRRLDIWNYVFLECTKEAACDKLCIVKKTKK